MHGTFMEKVEVLPTLTLRCKCIMKTNKIMILNISNFLWNIESLFLF